jgi:hypothetical protein
MLEGVPVEALSSRALPSAKPGPAFDSPGVDSNAMSNKSMSWGLNVDRCWDVGRLRGQKRCSR